MSEDQATIWFPAKRYGWGWSFPVTWQGWLVVLAYLCTATNATAHHGSAPFDTDTRVTLEGIITEFDYRNPHSFVHLRTTDSAGNRVDVAIESVGSSLRPYGVTRDSLVPGEQVIAVVNPSRRAPNEWALGVEIIKEDGTVVPLSVRFARELEQRGSTGSATSIAGVWAPRGEGFFNIVFGAGSWALTEKGRQSLQKYDVTQSSQAECIAVPPPTLMAYGSLNEVEILDDRVLIHSDWMDAERVIYTNGRSPTEAEIPTVNGYSLGHWEDGTLIVDTTHFSDNNSGYAFGIASGPQKHLIERFALTDDGTGLSYSFVLEDPEYLAETVSGETRWDYRPDLEPDEVACDLESAGRYLTE